MVVGLIIGAAVLVVGFLVVLAVAVTAAGHAQEEIMD